MTERNLGKCVWQSEDIYDSNYQTACGGSWDAETSDMEFCPFCGGTIEREHPADEEMTAFDGEVKHHPRCHTVQYGSDESRCDCRSYVP
jgi:hypothetical protein